MIMHVNGIQFIYINFPISYSGYFIISLYTNVVQARVCLAKRGAGNRS